MAPKYSRLRLKIPSLTQWNPGKPGNDWCGRTSASMIFNYYYAIRHGGFEAAKAEMIINNRDANAGPRDLIFRDAAPHEKFPLREGKRIAAWDGERYQLLATMQEAKPEGWEPAPPGKADGRRQILRPGDRERILAGNLLTEDEVVERLEPVIGALEKFNPVLFYSGLSPSVRHIVVISGYRIEPDGALSLHIDDPSSSSLTPIYDPANPNAPRTYAELGLIKHLTNGGAPDAMLQQERVADLVVDGEPGHRYWLRASMLFMPDTRTDVSTDLWCDHGDPLAPGTDSPGFTVFINTVAEARTDLVEAALDLRFPVALAEPSDEVPDPISAVWAAAAGSGAPFPLGACYAWHNGIHIPKFDAIADDGVYTMAAGTVVLAWFPVSAAGQEDRGMLVVRHAFDPKSYAFPPAPNGVLPEGAVWIHSLYGNLAGGAAGAAHLLAPVDPGTSPEERHFVPGGTPTKFLFEGSTSDGKSMLLPVECATAPAAPELDSDKVFAVAGTEFHALPQAQTNIEVWESRPLLPVGRNADVEARLKASQSMLVGVVLDGKAWTRVDDVVEVPATCTDATARVYLKVKSKGSDRVFYPDKTAGQDFHDIPIAPGMRLHCVEHFKSGGKERALCEVRVVVGTLEDNLEDIARCERLRKLHTALLTELTGKTIVDLARAEAESGVELTESDRNSVHLRYREVFEGRIGTMGVLRPGAEPVLGVHVEVFSHENFLPVGSPSGRWRVIQEAGNKPSGSAEFFVDQLEVVLDDDVLRSRASKPRPDGSRSIKAAVDDEEPPERSHWLEFCSDVVNARELSRIVAAHESEWMLDWDEQVNRCGDNSKAKHAVRNLPADSRARVWPTSTDLPGLDGGTFHFYHPLRLAEWLTTGIEVAMHDMTPERLAELQPHLLLGGATIPLSLSPIASSSYRLRLLLGDTLDDGEETDDDDESPEANRGFLVLDGLGSNNDVIEVEIVRQQVTRLSLTDPGASITVGQAPLALTRMGAPVGVGNIACRQDDPSTVHLLADVSDAMATLSCRRASIVIALRYNVEMPDHVSLNLGGTGFFIENVTVRGANVAVPGAGWAGTTAHELSLWPLHDPVPDEDGELPLVVASSTVQIEVDIISDGNIDQSASLDVRVEGGDLAAPVDRSIEIATREVVPECSGEDVLTLQLLLSQILVDTHPCLLGKDDKADKQPWVDSRYGGSLGRALWRFCLRFSSASDWPAELATAHAKNGDHTFDRVVRSEADIDKMAGDLHKTLGGITVDAPLIAAIVSKYALPYIAVRCRLNVVAFEAMRPLSLTTEDKAWGKWNATKRSRVPPVADCVVLHIKGVLESDAPGDLDTVGVTWAMRDAPEYELVDGTSTTLADVIANGVHLVATGKITEDKHKPVIAIEGDTTATLDLGGCHPIGSGAEGLDAAFVQHWLTRYLDEKGKAYLSGTVDGAFGGGSTSAWSRFCKAECKKNDTYAEQIETLVAGNPGLGGMAQGAY